MFNNVVASSLVKKGDLPLLISCFARGIISGTSFENDHLPWKELIENRKHGLVFKASGIGSMQMGLCLLISMSFTDLPALSRLKVRCHQAGLYCIHFLSRYLWTLRQVRTEYDTITEKIRKCMGGGCVVPGDLASCQIQSARGEHV